MPKKSKIVAKRKKASRKIGLLRKEGYPPKQAIAIGLKYAGLTKKTKKKKKK
jgi:hypothetical protein